MTFSFKKFVELVDQEEDLTEEQLDEIFGIFSTHDEKQKKIQAQKKAEFDERRAALKAKGKVDPTAGAAKNDQRASNDPRRLGAITPKPATARQGAAQGRAAELDWVNNMSEGRQSVAAQVKKDLEEQKKLGVRISAKALAYPETHEKEMQKYYDNGMSIEEIADHVKTLASIK